MASTRACREAVAKAEASGNVSQTASELGISNKTLHTWDQAAMVLFSRRVVGWAMGEIHDAAPATSALDIAIVRVCLAVGLSMHLDRVSEFANAQFHGRAAEHEQLL